MNCARQSCQKTDWKEIWFSESIYIVQHREQVRFYAVNCFWSAGRGVPEDTQSRARLICEIPAPGVVVEREQIIQQSPLKARLTYLKEIPWNIASSMCESLEILLICMIKNRVKIQSRGFTFLLQQPSDTGPRVVISLLLPSIAYLCLSSENVC